MIAWTIQPYHIWEMLQRDGILYGPGRESLDDSPEWQIAYHWLVVQMEKRIGPCPKPEIYPLWAWYQYENAQRYRPDLRSTGHLEPGTKGVRIELEIDENQILLSDFDMWHAPLNYSYLSLSEEEDEDFDAAFYQKDTRRFSSGGKHVPDPVYHARIVKSWERIFDLDWVDETGWYGSKSRAEKRIQGTFGNSH